MARSTSSSAVSRRSWARRATMCCPPRDGGRAHEARRLGARVHDANLRHPHDVKGRVGVCRHTGHAPSRRLPGRGEDSMYDSLDTDAGR
eukprot:614716-Prymnesium_polylepis.1